jgi:hypothetical protein
MSGPGKQNFDSYWMRWFQVMHGSGERRLQVVLEGVSASYSEKCF